MSLITTEIDNITYQLESFQDAEKLMDILDRATPVDKVHNARDEIYIKRVGSVDFRIAINMGRIVSREEAQKLQEEYQLWREEIRSRLDRSQ